MRASLKKTMVVSLAAPSLGLSVVAAPAQQQWPHPSNGAGHGMNMVGGGHGGHNFGGHGGGNWHGGGHGWGGGAAVGAGVLGALAVGGIIAAQQNNDECIQYRPT